METNLRRLFYPYENVTVDKQWSLFVSDAHSNRPEVNGSSIPVFVYAKVSQLCNYVGFSESRIQDVKEPHAAREPQFGHVWYTG